MPKPKSDPIYEQFEESRKALERNVQNQPQRGQGLGLPPWEQYYADAERDANQPGMPPMPTINIRAGEAWPASEIPDETVMPDAGPANVAAGGMDPNKAYSYAILASLLGSAGAGLGQAFRPWVRPPQPLPSPQAPQMPITAPSALQALTQTRAARKGF